MNFIEQVDDIADKLCVKIEEAIKNDNYQILGYDASTFEISVCDEVVQIWMANEPEDTTLYFIQINDDSEFVMPFYTTKATFKDPSKVRRILRSKALVSSPENSEYNK